MGRHLVKKDIEAAQRNNVDALTIQNLCSLLNSLILRYSKLTFRLYPFLQDLDFILDSLSIPWARVGPWERAGEGSGLVLRPQISFQIEKNSALILGLKNWKWKSLLCYCSFRNWRWNWKLLWGCPKHIAFKYFAFFQRIMCKVD